MKKGYEYWVYNIRTEENNRFNNSALSDERTGKMKFHFLLWKSYSSSVKERIAAEEISRSSAFH